MFEKTTEIINNSKPDFCLYELWGIKKNSSGFYQQDCVFYEHFTFSKFFETAKDAAEALFHKPMCDEYYIENKTGFRCNRYALVKITDEILDEIKNSILETEFFYPQEQYDDYPDCGEEAFPYTHLTEKFVKSWTSEDLLKYCEYKDKLHEGDFSLCTMGEYKNFIVVYNYTDENYYFGLVDHVELEDYTPAENFADEDEENEEENED